MSAAAPVIAFNKKVCHLQSENYDHANNGQSGGSMVNNCIYY